MFQGDMLVFRGADVRWNTIARFFKSWPRLKTHLGDLLKRDLHLGKQKVALKKLVIGFSLIEDTTLPFCNPVSLMRHHECPYHLGNHQKHPSLH